MSWLIGHTGQSFLDYWTISHLSFWMVVGSSLAALRVRYDRALVGSMALAFLWEVFERVAERAWSTVWLSPESWWNAWASDPLTCVVALSVAYYGYAKWRPV